jgi:hypothetical protein
MIPLKRINEVLEKGKTAEARSLDRSDAVMIRIKIG